jgi:hypothetical protein
MLLYTTVLLLGAGVCCAAALLALESALVVSLLSCAHTVALAHDSTPINNHIFIVWDMALTPFYKATLANTLLASARQKKAQYADWAFFLNQLQLAVVF